MFEFQRDFLIRYMYCVDYAFTIQILFFRIPLFMFVFHEQSSHLRNSKQSA